MDMAMGAVRAYVVEGDFELSVKQWLIHNTTVDMFGAVE